MKKALMIIGIIVALFLIVTALMPSSVHVERSIEISAPVEVVFDQVADLEKNFSWSPWAEKDPNMVVEWGEIRSGLGASYSWKGNDDVGSGTMTIKELTENEYIANELDFGEMGVGVGTWQFESVYVESKEGNLSPQTTKVTWGLDSELGWPLGRMFGPFMDGMVGADFEYGLKKLKEVCESIEPDPAFQVMEVETSEMTLLVYKDSCSTDSIEPKSHELMGRMAMALEDKPEVIVGAPLFIYHVWDEENKRAVLEAAFPIGADAELDLMDGYEIKTLPAGQAAKVSLVGSYDLLMDVHTALNEWIVENGREMAGPPWEQYLNNPQEVQDESELMTDVYYPIQ